MREMLRGVSKRTNAWYTTASSVSLDRKHKRLGGGDAWFAGSDVGTSGLILLWYAAKMADRGAPWGYPSEAC